MIQSKLIPFEMDRCQVVSYFEINDKGLFLSVIKNHNIFNINDIEIIHKKSISLNPKYIKWILENDFIINKGKEEEITLLYNLFKQGSWFIDTNYSDIYKYLIELKRYLNELNK